MNMQTCHINKDCFLSEFFFEAIVSVNLTSLLVLTTLFISVSGSLPQTAYIKMVDVWLIFAQAVPWVEVLLHTWIDASRTEGEEGREINNHGKSITVGGKDDKEIYMSSNTDNGSSFTPALTPDVPDSNLSKNMERVQASVCLCCRPVQFVGRPRLLQIFANFD